MIKDFETYINEDYFSKLANRKETGIERKGSKISNIKDIKPIDMGTTCLWADVDFCYCDSFKQTMKDFLSLKNEFEKYGWRFPTNYEYELLLTCCDTEWVEHKEEQYETFVLTSKSTHKQLTFDTSGKYEPRSSMKTYFEKFDTYSYMGFTSDKPTQPEGGAGLYLRFDASSGKDEHDTIITPNLTSSKMKGFLRLVKDK